MQSFAVCMLLSRPRSDRLYPRCHGPPPSLPRLPSSVPPSERKQGNSLHSGCTFPPSHRVFQHRPGALGLSPSGPRLLLLTAAVTMHGSSSSMGTGPHLCIAVRPAPGTQQALDNVTRRHHRADWGGTSPGSVERNRGPGRVWLTQAPQRGGNRAQLQHSWPSLLLLVTLVQLLGALGAHPSAALAAACVGPCGYYTRTLTHGIRSPVVHQFAFNFLTFAVRSDPAVRPSDVDLGCCGCTRSDH